MACRRVAPSHWVGVGTLVLALLLSLAGVGSPWWRMVNGLHTTSYKGLWQQCFSSADRDTECRFNQESSGLWRAVQVTKLLSLLVLVSAVVMSVVYISGRGRAGRRCPASSMAAWLGGLTSLLADLIYVGFIERHSDHAPKEIVYAWSFALSVAGSIFALFAAFILCLAARYCGPRFTSHLAKPYLPYRHFSVDVDKHGRCVKVWSKL
ncbi:hypothetical protein V1264_012730 [Littorina saxatilis]|uniref:Claudin n=1 Tax=Littorina saxatilis TaxID=31220 RepID=A0AAN9BVK4_9CAEN